MTSPKATPPNELPTSDANPPARNDKLKELLSPYTVFGLAFGIGTGLWAVHVHKVLKHESDVLLAMATGDVALLAIILAAVALLGSFLQGNYGRVIKSAVGLDLFYFPFRIVAVVSAVAAFVCFAGAMDAESGVEWLRAALFGAGVWLTVWTILGTVFLTFTFIWYSVDSAEEAENQP